VLLKILVTAQVALSRLVRRVRPDDAGQTTAEYALVLVGVAAVALLLVAWAGDTNKIGRLLDGVLDSILDKIP
jgi:Flp pilus assembly pilin Flp